MRITYLASLTSLTNLSLPFLLLTACGDDKGDDTTETTQTTQTTQDPSTDPGTTDAITTGAPGSSGDGTTTSATSDPSTTSTTSDPSTTSSATTTDPSTTSSTGETTDPSTTSGETSKTTGDDTTTTGDDTTGGGGLGEGEICQDMPDGCAKGLLCCYPCGIPDCMNQCIKPDPNTNECPLFP